MKACTCTIFLRKNVLKEWNSSKKCSLPYKYVTFPSPKKVTVIYKLVIVFKLVQFFFQEEVSLWRLESFLKSIM